MISPQILQAPAKPSSIPPLVADLLSLQRLSSALTQNPQQWAKLCPNGSMPRLPGSHHLQRTIHDINWDKHRYKKCLKKKNMYSTTLYNPKLSRYKTCNSPRILFSSFQVRLKNLESWTKITKLGRPIHGDSEASVSGTAWLFQPVQPVTASMELPSGKLYNSLLSKMAIYSGFIQL